MNKFLSALKAIGAVIAWPFTHAQKIEHVYSTVKADLPPTVLACKDLAKLFVSAGPDVLAAVASKGFDVSEDVKSAIDIKAIFAFAKDTLVPTLEKDFTDLKLAALGEATDGPTAGGPAPAPSPAPVEVTAAPGLHNVVPA